MSLTEATRHLTDVNRQIETTVDERRPALENLAAGLQDAERGARRPDEVVHPHHLARR